MRLGFLALVTATLGVGVCSAISIAPAATFTGGSYGSHSYNQTVGWAFHVNTDTPVISLMWYDSDGTHKERHEIGIWRNGVTGTPLVSGCINCTTGDAVYDPVTKYWVQLVPSVTLTAGSDYVIGGLIAPNDLILDNIGTVSTIPSLTFLQNRYGYIGSPSPYDYTLGNPLLHYSPQGLGYVGPNFGTPEPGTYALMGTVGLALFLINRRSTQQSEE